MKQESAEMAEIKAFERKVQWGAVWSPQRFLQTHICMHMKEVQGVGYIARGLGAGIAGFKRRVVVRFDGFFDRPWTCLHAEIAPDSSVIN